MIVPVILAGGSGTRLWPLSRSSYPKQFLRLLNQHSLLQNTILRLRSLDLPFTAPMVICGEEHRFIVAEQLREIDIDQADIILEPIGRNTAPAITLAALHAQKKYQQQNVSLFILSADHEIQNHEAFKFSIEQAYGYLNVAPAVIFGIKPTYPETGYGYIKYSASIDSGTLYHVENFVEKPDLATAENYLRTGGYAWNSGMFMFDLFRFLDLMDQYANDIKCTCINAYETSIADLDFIRIDLEKFKQCPNISIDYALIERVADLLMVQLDAGWSDIGSWSALFDIQEKDKDQNVLKGDVIQLHSQKNLVYAQDKLVSLLGVTNLIVVETKDAILIANQAYVQHVKDIVQILKDNKRTEITIHCEAFRPWGKYECIDVGTRYQVKRITVNKGQKLSLQLHHHRAEHWIVVKGTAKVRKGENTFLLSENESTYISIGEIHSLENPGCIPLELIEIQTGSYLNEDDIHRFEDLYGRVQ
ncbi:MULTISPECIES: mannose-1-phosphate guanylyltransferase/mannose-6-phosphate isomerase [Acinetobacter]|uniref:mannose-1-phosphate guanylyltransferase n=1 Tax=Acinetobacter chengduensis TaxID=2420890 RepID=A0ABX9TV99_9GAMM|nr:MULTISPECIES: mannose-1-phosphate guanylyltransferase/mannose-6-phosphate isomerase [Acinetobacter]MBI1451843.1 mannose-1-phosphate guanylyltransferase/mannose-6-phosphate isomerase [Acinetobacter sp. FL51]RKG44179.1 mannose-1-phosphate guanylyltransferase/mannose-6-phosphate isomerase [Acinetobacter sp. WCHAc060007]RLL21514.1 mannose-1-phosphate guanylyltransferase/mannose-6-phosphate isomerase [Acinetobacter chengduensis]